MSNQDPVLAAEFFRGLANDKRHRIVFEILSDKREHTVGEVATRMSIAASTASEHLSLLKRSGIVTARKKDREVYYALDKSSIRQMLNHLSDWLDCC